MSDVFCAAGLRHHRQQPCVPNGNPLCDGENITAYQKKINDEFTDGIQKSDWRRGSTKICCETSNHAVQRGWEAFRAGRYAFSVRRFNEGWLLDDSNPGSIGDSATAMEQR